MGHRSRIIQTVFRHRSCAGFEKFSDLFTCTYTAWYVLRRGSALQTCSTMRRYSSTQGYNKAADQADLAYLADMTDIAGLTDSADLASKQTNSLPGLYTKPIFPPQRFCLLPTQFHINEPCIVPHLCVVGFPISNPVESFLVGPRQTEFNGGHDVEYPYRPGTAEMLIGMSHFRFALHALLQHQPILHEIDG